MKKTIQLIKDLDSAEFNSNIAGDMGMDIEIDTKGLNDTEINELRDRMYPKVISSFQKHSEVMKGLLSKVLENTGHNATAGYLKCVYCRVKSDLTSNGTGVSEVYSRELVTGIVQDIEERVPDISFKSEIEVMIGRERKSISLEVDSLVMNEFMKYMDESKVRERIKSLALKKVEFDMEQLLPVKNVSKIVVAKYRTPNSIDLGKSDLGMLKGKGPGFPTASITIQICYEEEDGCLCSYCNEYTLWADTAMG